MIANLGGPMSVLMPAALLSTLPVLFLLFRQRLRRPLVLASLGLLLFMAALTVTLAVNVPIDAEINRWTLDTFPSDWTATRDRWQVFHTIRTFTSLAGLGCMIASVLDGRDRNGLIEVELGVSQTRGTLAKPGDDQPHRRT